MEYWTALGITGLWVLYAQVSFVRESSAFSTVLGVQQEFNECFVEEWIWQCSMRKWLRESDSMFPVWSG